MEHYPAEADDNFQLVTLLLHWNEELHSGGRISPFFQEVCSSGILAEEIFFFLKKGFWYFRIEKVLLYLKKTDLVLFWQTVYSSWSVELSDWARYIPLLSRQGWTFGNMPLILILSVAALLYIMNVEKKSC